MAFSMSSIKKLYIPESVEGLSIKNNAFSDCVLLESVTLPDNVIDIADTAFRKCNFERLTVYSNSEYVENYCKLHDIKWEEAWN